MSIKEQISEIDLLIRTSSPFIDDDTQFSDINCELINWKELLSLAARNRVMRNLRDNLKRKTIRDIFPEEVASKIGVTGAKIQQQTDALLQEIPEINRILQKQMIEWVLIKTIKPFPSECSDIDILLPSEQHLRRATRTLEKEGYFVSTEDGVEPEKVKLHKMCRSFEGLPFPCVIDLHGKVTQDGLDFIDRTNIWIRKQKFAELDVNVPSPEDDFLITAIQSFYGDNVIYLRDLFHLIGLARKSIDWEYVVTSAARYGWESSIFSVISCIDFVGFPKSYSSMYTKAKTQAMESLSTRMIKQFLPQQKKKKQLPALYPMKIDLLSNFFKMLSDASRNDLHPSPYARHIRRMVGIRLSRDPRLAYVVNGFRQE